MNKENMTLNYVKTKWLDKVIEVENATNKPILDVK